MAGGALEQRRSAVVIGKSNGRRTQRMPNSSRDPRHRLQHRRRQVRVLVRVQVGGRDARRDDLAHLRRQLVVQPDLALARSPPAIRDTVAGSGRPVSTERPPTSTRWQPTSSVGCSRRQPHRIVERRAVGHQRGGGQNAVAMRLHDALVHVRREAEIVRVDHQLFATRQNSFSRMVRNFLGLARMSLQQATGSRAWRRSALRTAAD